MFVRKGQYQHPNDEVNVTAFEIIHRRSPRGRQMTAFHRLHLWGEIIAVGQDAISARIGPLIDAYAIPNEDVGLYDDNGVVTRHRLEQANSLTGVRIVHRSWPKGDCAEYATLRTFYIVAEAEYPDLESELIDRHETVRNIGVAGIRRRYIEYQNGQGEEQIVNQMGVQEIIQSGYAIGFFGWPTNDVPAPLFPNLELTDLRQINPDGPTYRGNAFTEYRIDWTYVMQSTTPQAAFPTIL